MASFTRQELYELVWSKPITQLGKELGISDQGISKACRRNDIPTPQLGYWSKLAHGKSVRQPPLENEKFKPDDEVHVSPGVKMRPKRQKPEAAPSEEAQHTAIRPVDVTKAPAPQETKPDPLVDRLEKGLRKAKSSDGFVHNSIGPFTIKISPDQVDRTLTILSSIVLAARAEGWGIDKDSLRIQDETIEIAITETQDSMPHIPTPYELREKARYSWRRIPEKDYFPSGLLKLAITNADYLGIRVNWADGKKQRLETILPSFIEGLADAARAKEERRLEREEQSRQFALEQKRQERERRRREIDRVRGAILKDFAAKHRQAKELSVFVGTVKAKFAGRLDQDLPAVREWIEWAEGYVKRIDPLENGLPILLSEEDTLRLSWEYPKDKFP